jgi:hypothetical protein
MFVMMIQAPLESRLSSASSAWDPGCSGGLVLGWLTMGSRMGFWACVATIVTDGIAGMQGDDWRTR